MLDGSPNEGTVLTLTHWPGYGVPPSLAADLSAEIVFNYLEHPIDHPPADIVTSDHFDQDGLACIYSMVEAETALENRDLLIDLARAGDFAVFNDRRAARASMALSRMAEMGDNGDYSEFTAMLYTKAMEIVVPLLQDPEPFRSLWAEEDEAMRASEAAITDGKVVIVERDDVDLAVVTISPDFVSPGGHRFGGQRFEGIHPMALHAATQCMRLLLIQGQNYRYVDRYESWIQYRSRAIPPRVDLRPLSEVLTAMERRHEVWNASGPGSLTPELTHSGESTIEPDVLIDLVSVYLRSQPPAWDPFSAERS